MDGWISFYLKNLLEEYPEFFGGERNLINQNLNSLSNMESAPRLEGMHPRPRLVKYSWELKLILLGAEDLLDLHRYRLIEQQVKYDGQIKPALLCRPLIKTIHQITKNRWLLRSNKVLLGQTKKLLDCLSDVHALSLEMGFERNPVGIDERETISFPPNKYFGYDKESDRLLKLLTSELSTSRNYSVAAIVGQPGIGKTTLAQYIYNHELVMCHFDTKIWVCVSHKLDLLSCTVRIIEYFDQQRCQINILDVLQRELKKRLKWRRILLVLDDIYYGGIASDASHVKQLLEDDMQWEQFLAPFAWCGKGSRILVTSRSDRLPLALRSSNYIKLDQMEVQDYLSLLTDYVFLDTVDRSAVQVQPYLEILSEISKKLISPLEAITVGYRLRSRMDLAFWEMVLRDPNILFTLGDRYASHWTVTMAVYHQLVAPLKRCFSLCSIFPKGYKHEMNSLVQLWVAQCFIKSTDAGISAEDTGKEYFQELLSRSIFKPFRDQESDPVKYIMDDLFHQLAKHISSIDCFRLEDADRMVQIPPSVYHLSVQCAYLKEHKSNICQLHNLRTLILFGPPTDDLEGSYKFLEELFLNLRNLRVLDISFYSGSIIPNIISNLKHLRYLNLAATSVTDLPISICKLYHLQFLKLNPLIKELPSNLGDIERLQFV